MPSMYLTLGAHVPVTSYVVEIHPDGGWIVNAIDDNDNPYSLPVAEGRGSRRGDGRIENARRNAAKAIQAHERRRKEHDEYEMSVVRYSVPTNSA